MIFMHNYFNCSTYYPTNIELSNIMLNIKDSSYWKYSYNCNITITPQFESRMFNLSDNNSNVFIDEKRNELLLVKTGFF